MPGTVFFFWVFFVQMFAACTPKHKKRVNVSILKQIKAIVSIFQIKAGQMLKFGDKYRYLQKNT